jgi:hypothetical protein
MSDLPITIAGWPKGRETVQVRLDTYNNRNVVDVRCWYADNDGNLKPGQSGITLQTAQLPQLSAALIKALETAKAAGLMPADDSPTQ